GRLSRSGAFLGVRPAYVAPFRSRSRLAMRTTLFPYTTLFRSWAERARRSRADQWARRSSGRPRARAISVTTSVLTRRRPSRKQRSEEHTSELQYVKISYAVFCLKKKRTGQTRAHHAT